jgi:hypothetical protein
MWYCCMGSRRGEGLASLISLMLFSGLLYIMALYSFPSFRRFVRCVLFRRGDGG